MNPSARRRATLATAALAFWLSLLPASAAGQAPAEPRFGIRGFLDVAPQTFLAHDTFDAVLGESSGTFVGGGGQVRWRNLLIEVAASRFKQTGERVFVFNREVFPLGIPTTVTIVPVELTGAYRFKRLWRLRPYAGGGIGWHTFKETSAFAEPGENVDTTDRSYHLLGGAEVPLWRWIAAAAEVRHRTVPDAIGASGAAREFGEDNLGGTSLRVRFIVNVR